MAYTIQEILSDEETTLRLYFDDIADSRPLSREREVELAARIQEGDMVARDELVNANLRFVIDVAKNYQNRGLSLSDLISAGNVGLLTAAERFDGTKGYKFISYAVWWIKQSILQSIAEHARTVRLPLNKLSLLKDISKASRKLGQGREGEPAIEEIARRIEGGDGDVVLLGATGTGKSATTAWLVERLQRPTLVMAPNKTLAAQLATEFRELLPHNAVEYFVSYYDYYQPEAYVPQTDTFIEKDSSINEEVERLRHSATNSLLTRRDVLVVASVSAIYGLGTPQEYVDRMVRLRVGEERERDALLRMLVDIQYTRNDIAFERGTFRVRGDTVEVFPMYEEHPVRIEMFGDDIERLMTLHPVTGEILTEDQEMYIFPATHYVAGPERMERAIGDIEAELQERLAELETQGKQLEAQRLRMRTSYDVEMMRPVSYTHLTLPTNREV